MAKAASWARLGVALVLCLGVGAAGGFATRSEIAGWYAKLAKPAWTPPDAAFPIVWTLLYVLMAVAVWRLWDAAPPSPARRNAIVLFIVQICLNAVWTPLFFSAHALAAALAVIVMLDLAVLATIVIASRADGIAALLLVPYLLWIVYATGLNAGIYLANP